MYVYREPKKCSDRLGIGCEEKEESRMTPQFLVQSMEFVIVMGKTSLVREDQEIAFI